jgi:hypothetical protein
LKNDNNCTNHDVVDKLVSPDLITLIRKAEITVVNNTLNSYAGMLKYWLFQPEKLQEETETCGKYRVKRYKSPESMIKPTKPNVIKLNAPKNRCKIGRKIK